MESTNCSLAGRSSSVGSMSCPLGMQAAPSSIPMSGTFFRGGLAILPLTLIQEEQFQLLEKECTLSAGKLPSRLAQEQCG